MKRISVALMLMFLISPLFAAGQGERAEKNDDPGILNLITTTNIIHDVVSRIAGDGADVEVLLDYGQNPHAFEPAPRDMARIEKADVVFVNGFDLEETLIRSISTLDIHRIVEISAGVDALSMSGIHDEHDSEDSGEHEEGDDHEGEHNHEGGVDPHTWMSPVNVMGWADVIVQVLSEEDPDNADYYAQRAREYKDELSELDRKIRDSLTVIPEEKRVIVTGHNAFGYFAREYGIEVVGTIIPGFSTSAEPSAREMAELLGKLKQKNVRALFVGVSSGDAVYKLARSLEEESDGEAEVVEFLTGSLRARGEEADSYISFMEYNLKQIMYGLQL